MAESSVPIITMLSKSGPFARFILLFISSFSVLSIAVILLKIRAYRAQAGRNRAFLKGFNAGAALTEVRTGTDPKTSGALENIFRTGIAEFNRLLETVMAMDKAHVTSFFMESQFSIIKDQIDKTASEESQKSDRYLVLLAIAGSTSPLLGLLGTVWGIMRAFAEIGLRGSASLTVVAPGIAEALITTIWGIAVAIPSVIAYNYFASKSRTLEDDSYNFAALLLNRVKISFFELLNKKKTS